MMIGRPIFFTHNINDNYYKFVKAKNHQSFWKALEKNLKCNFHENFKTLINGILF